MHDATLNPNSPYRPDPQQETMPLWLRPQVWAEPALMSAKKAESLRDTIVGLGTQEVPSLLLPSSWNGCKPVAQFFVCLF